MNDDLEIGGESEGLKLCLDYVDLVAHSDASVLILGESGVGKEVIAQRVHARSGRANRRLVTVNCAAIARDLFESEFFGHVRGAFTGATRDRPGRLESAHGGTLYLDEVGEIPPELQGKLLRALQQGAFERVGEDRTRQADVRIVAATNRSLSEDVASGRFRRDLYYRLSTFPIEVPPLRERVDDIAPLAKMFVRALARKYRCRMPELTKRDLGLLTKHDWPGNVRELKNVVERAFLLGRKSGRLEVQVALGQRGPVPVAVNDDAEEQALPTGDGRGFLTEAEMREFERQNLITALETSGWKISGSDGAAAAMGVKPTTLTSRLGVLGITKPERASLYCQLGGERVIAAMARDLLGRLQADPKLGRFWVHRSTVGIAREERLLAQYLCSALGGPRAYMGRSMIATHEGLGITASDWKVFGVHVAATFDAFGIAPGVRSKLTGMIEALKDEVVV